jgi:hypothetical protein
MIAYIEEPIPVANIDNYILDNFGIYYTESQILPQKIQLPEQDMNWLFSEIFMGEADIEYAWCGGGL